MLPPRLVSLLAFLFILAWSHPLPAQDQPAPATAPAANAFFFQDGDTPAVFLGDSITEQKMFTTLIETYTLTRFPNLNVTFRNAGWGGDTAWLQQRGDYDTGLARDVLGLKPKAVLIDFGMNDARGGDANYSKYLDYTTRLVKDLEKAGARVVLITPSPEERYEASAPGGSSYNVVLQKFIDGLKLVADNEKIPLIDQFTPFIKTMAAGRDAGVLNKEVKLGDPNAVRLTNEGVHPNWGGHLVMAATILQGLNAPSLVSTVTVDAAAKSIVSCQDCLVDWQDAAGVVQIKRTDDCLPWPIPSDPAIDAALKIPGFDPATALNRYELKVTGLTAPTYKLQIDNIDVGTFASDDLGKGVNLALLTQGPIYDQCQDLLKAVQAKNEIYFNRWRNVQLFALPAWLSSSPGVDFARKTELDRLDKQLADAQASIEALRKTTPHIFKLVPVK